MEIWKESNTHLGVMVSSAGRVRLPVTQSTLPNGGTRIHSTKPVLGSVSRASKGASHKYMDINTRKLGHMKVHQLVCSTFHGKKPTLKSVVIHIDENGCNNEATNLRWGTQKENLNMPKFIAYCKSRTGANSPATKGKLNKVK
jgi:hypothetical protein